MRTPSINPASPKSRLDPFSIMVDSHRIWQIQIQYDWNYIASSTFSAKFCNRFESTAEIPWLTDFIGTVYIHQNQWQSLFEQKQSDKMRENDIFCIILFIFTFNLWFIVVLQAFNMGVVAECEKKLLLAWFVMMCVGVLFVYGLIVYSDFMHS